LRASRRIAALGVTMLLRRSVIYIFRSLPILSLKEPLPDDTARIALLKASASAPFSSPTTPG